LNGKWGNYFTCLYDFDTCPLDGTHGIGGYGVAATLIDPRSWEDRNGVTHKNQKRLVVFKGKARERIVRMIEEKKDLKYAILDFSRGSSATEASTGEDIQFVGQTTKDKLKGFIRRERR